MSEANETLSDSEVEQIAEMMPHGGFQILEALVDADEPMTTPEIADALGWTEDEVEEVLQEMEDLGLLGPPSLGECVYVGSLDYTLAEAASSIGLTVEETIKAFVEIEEAGLAKCVQISEHEYLIDYTEAGIQEAERLGILGIERPEDVPGP